MKFGVITAMPEEKIKLIEVLDNVEKYKFIDREIIVGKYQEHFIIVAESGIGKVNASMMTTHIIEQFSPDYIINTGSAGAISDQLSIGDVVIGKYLKYYDVNNKIFNYKIGQIPGEPEMFHSDEALMEHIPDSLARKGLIVTGDSFVTPDIKHKIVNDFPDTMAAEMEGAAIAQTATKFSVPFIIIRAISDQADGNADVDFEEFVVQAGRQSAELLLTLISHF